MKQKDEHGPEGFWPRAGACLIDLILVVGFVISISRIGVLLNRYVPIELTVLLLLPAYSVIAHLWKGQTVGKWLCGLIVLGSDGKTVELGRIILRETVAKWLSAIAFGLGFIWCAISRRKRAFHDYLAGTSMHSKPSPLGHWGQPVAWLTIITTIILAVDLPSTVRTAKDWFALKSTASMEFPFERRDKTLMVEAASLDDAKMQAYSGWIRDHADSPAEYAVSKAQQHQVIVFGEVHEKKEALDFLNASIPLLYHQAGVTRVAMETYLAEDNDLLERLVTADTFDRELAMQIARHQPWGIWGFKEYWDVMETVWRLNQTIPANQEKMLILGLDSRMDMQSLGMTIGEGDNPSKQCPVWEKLRIIRLPRILPKVQSRDICMARQIEREIIDKGKRGVVWVGNQHALASPQPVSPKHSVSRMGALLRERHGERVFFIRLHGFDISAAYLDPAYRGPEPIISRVVEEIIQKSGLNSAGFDTAASPFGYLRDSAAWSYHYEPRLGIQDIADGYLYIKPWHKYTECSWLANYVSPRMFASNKPFYQTFGKKSGIRLESADDVNHFFENQ